MASSPRINTKALAEMLRLPAYSQLTILQDQKYPKKGPNAIRTPFYSPAMNGIREFYRQDNDRAALIEARQAAAQSKLLAKQNSNVRVLDAFERGAQHNRKLQPVANTRLSVKIRSVEIRLSADMRAQDSKGPRLFFYNLRNAPLQATIATDALEIAHWILEENGQALPPGTVEYVDLHAQKAYKLSSTHKSVINLVKKNVLVIESLWAGI